MSAPRKPLRDVLVSVILLACLLIAGSAWGISPRVAVCTPAKAPPVLDGKLDDPCWKTAGVVTDFLLDSGKGIATDATVTRLCFDKQNLYIGIECFEDDWGRVKADVRDHDGNIDSDDDIEIFFDTNSDRKTYYQFMLNTLGTKTEILNGSKAWDCDWTVKIVKGVDRWVAEVAIPMKVLGKAKIGSTWGFNIGRGQAGKRVYASFAGITGKWSAPGRFATLKFAARGGEEGRIFKKRGGVRIYALHPQKPLDLLNLPAPDDEYLAAFGTPGEVVPYTFHVFNVERKKAVTVRISAEAFTGPGGTIAVAKDALLYLYQRIAGGYPWEFLTPGSSITVPAGQRGGFWLDLRIPEDAGAGLYTGKVTVSFDGKKHTRRPKLLVLPFKLELDPTSHGFHYPKEKDPGQVRESMRLMREHGMTTFAPYGGWGGARGVSEYVRLRKEFAFEGKPIYADTCMYVGDRLARAMRLPKRGPKSLQKGRAWVINDEYKRRYVAELKKYYDEAVRVGAPEMSFSIGDELTNDGYWAAQHLIERAKALREKLPKINLTTDTNGYTECVGASKYLNCVGVNDGWDGPDNHNGGRKILTPAVMSEIKANGCGIEFVNTGTDRFPFGLYLWRMQKYGVESKIEWIWRSSRMQPAWLNILREGGKTYVTVALKFSRIGTYDTRYLATLENILKTRPDPKARQLVNDIIAHIPVALAESRRSGWNAERLDTVRWMVAKEIMRLKGRPVGVAAAAPVPGEFRLDPSSRWSTAKLEKKFIRHKTRTFACAKVAAPPVLDGNLNDAAWKSAEVITGAYRDSDLSLVEGMMTVRTVHTDRGVYLGVRSHEPKPKKIATSTKGFDDPNLWQVDDIEVFIDPGKTGTYYHLLYDSKGTRSDYKKTEITWNGEWQVANRLLVNTWTSEVFLPFATFGGKDKPWAIFVGRGSPTRGEYYGIMPIQGSWHSVSQFGTLEFKPVGLHIYHVTFPQLQIGKNVVFMRAGLPGQRTRAPVLPGWISIAGGPLLALEATPATGRAGTYVRYTRTFDLRQAGEQEIKLLLTERNGKPVDSETFIAQVPELLSLSLDQASVFSTSRKRSGTVAVNVAMRQLLGHSLDFELIGVGVYKKVSVRNLGGNRLAFRLTLLKLREGKYQLKATLRKGVVPSASKLTTFFLTNGPVFK